MARLIQGINGAFRGKVGSIVGFTRNGQGFIRGLPRKIHKAPSEKQQHNRKAMAAAQEWLKYIVPVVRVGFKNYSSKQHGFGNALSYLKLNAIREDFTVDPSKALISWGDLPAPAEATVAAVRPGLLEFTWDTTGGNWNDRTILLAYFDKRLMVANLCGARRREGRDMLACPAIAGMEGELYLGFMTEERDRCSNSVYLGRVVTG